MPNFDESTWAIFKQQLMSVLYWLLYSFRMLFDAVRSHPMLYAFVFFPIFAAAFFLILNFILNIVPFKPLFEGSDIHTDNSMLKIPKSHNNRLPNGKSINLATLREQSRGAVSGNTLGSARSGGFFGQASGKSSSINLGHGTSTSPTMSSGSGFGTGLASYAGDLVKITKENKEAYIEQKLKEDSNPIYYHPNGNNSFNSNKSSINIPAETDKEKEFARKHNLDIEADD